MYKQNQSFLSQPNPFSNYITHKNNDQLFIYLYTAHHQYFADAVINVRFAHLTLV